MDSARCAMRGDARSVGPDARRPRQPCSLRRAAGRSRWLGAFPFLIAALILLSAPASGCTNLLVDSDATVDGSTYVTYSCDGGVFAAIRVVSASHHDDPWIDLFEEPRWESGAPVSSSQPIGSIPQVRDTYRYLDVLAGPTFSHVGGMNEHGVSIAETTLVGGRSTLSNPLGWMAPFAVQPERSLMTIALARARSARDAVLLIGRLAETYGYHSPFPIDGEQLAIGDGGEVWSMEIFGPGPDWSPGCGDAGAVWCAQRIPDGHVGVSANRSRIGEIDLDDDDRFLASENVFSLAEEHGWWTPSSGEAFVWHDVYAPNDSWSSVVREWRVLSLVAPSLDLDPSDGRFPFSVAPDELLDTISVTRVQRDMLEGTEFDPLADPAFRLAGSDDRSPLACPMCSAAFYELLEVDPRARTVGNRYTSLSCLYQSHVDWPMAARGCTWYGIGPAVTTCYVPIYSGVSELPADWGDARLDHFDRRLPFWILQLPGRLAMLEWENAYADLQAVRDPAEARMKEEQADVLDRLESLSPADAAALLNEYVEARMNAVADGFDELADYLLTMYYMVTAGDVPAELPEVRFDR